MSQKLIFVTETLENLFDLVVKREKNYGNFLKFLKVFKYELGASSFLKLMIKFKIYRELHSHKKDNIMDIAGYALLGIAYTELFMDEHIAKKSLRDDYMLLLSRQKFKILTLLESPGYVPAEKHGLLKSCLLWLEGDETFGELADKDLFPMLLGSAVNLLYLDS